MCSISLVARLADSFVSTVTEALLLDPLGALEAPRATSQAGLRWRLPLLTAGTGIILREKSCCMVNKLCSGLCPGRFS